MELTAYTLNDIPVIDLEEKRNKWYIQYFNIYIYTGYSKTGNTKQKDA